MLITAGMWWTSLNVLTTGILPGREVAVLNDNEGLVSQLYKWIAAQQVG